LYWLSRIPVGGSYTTDLLPGLLLVGLGIAGLFVAVATAANAGVPSDKAGLAAALLNASQWLRGAPAPPTLTPARPPPPPPPRRPRSRPGSSGRCWWEASPSSPPP